MMNCEIKSMDAKSEKCDKSLDISVKTNDCLQEDAGVAPKSNNSIDRGEADVFKKPVITIKKDTKEKPSVPCNKPCKSRSDSDNSSGNGNNETDLNGSTKASSWCKHPPAHPKFSLTEISNGTVVKQIELNSKGFYLFGRSIKCDVPLLNPTVSRHHAVLQYGNPNGGSDYYWYITDLFSKYGTKVNKNTIESNVPSQLQNGYIFSLALSKRFFVYEIETSRYDNSDEFLIDMSQIELKAISKSGAKDDENAEEDPSDCEDDYETLRGQSLYQALRYWFQNQDREMKVDFKKFGSTHRCSIKLPLSDLALEETEDFDAIAESIEKDRSLYRAVSMCWEKLENLGFTPASAKRTRNWKENDYYDSDEDPFFDQTGDLEKKREKRRKRYGGNGANSASTSN